MHQNATGDASRPLTGDAGLQSSLHTRAALIGGLCGGIALLLLVLILLYWICCRKRKTKKKREEHFYAEAAHKGNCPYILLERK